MLRRRLLVSLALLLAVPVCAQPWVAAGPLQGHPEVYARDLYTRYLAARRVAADARAQLAADRASTLEDIRASGGSLGDTFKVAVQSANGAPARRALEQRIRDAESEMAAIEAEWSRWCEGGLALGPLSNVDRTIDDPWFNPATGLIEQVKRDVVDFRIRYFLEETERQARTDSLRPPLATVVSPGDGTITRADPARTAGSLQVGQRLFSASGSFPGEGKNAPIDVGYVVVPAPCRVKCHIVGNPPVPSVWSLGDWNSGLHLAFAAQQGAGYGAEGEVIVLGGQHENNDLSGECDLPGPGKAHLVIGHPRGSGPLSGGDFAQGFTASVEVVKLLDGLRAQGKSELMEGDTIAAGPSPTHLRLRDGTLLTVMPGSRVKLSESAPPMVRVELEAGWVRVTRWGAPHGQSTEITYKGLRLKPRGTDFLVRDLGPSARVEVLEGEVEYETGQGVVVVSAGERSVVGSGTVEAIPEGELAGLGEPEVDGAGIQSLALDDAAAPFGEETLTITGDRLSEGWVFEDPGHDARLEGSGRSLSLTVPNGNDLWAGTTTAPRLLRKVTGDFDLEATVIPPASAEEWTSMDFCIKAVGSGQGVIAGQMADGAGRDYWLPSGCWAWADGVGGRNLRAACWDETRAAYAWPVLPADPMLVRLSRRGDLWCASRSTDGGATWDLAGLHRASLPPTVWAGWVFKRQHSAATTTFALRDARIVSSPLGCGESPTWLHATADGAFVDAGDKRVRLSTDGSALASGHCLSSEPILGDFDLVVRYDLGGAWQHQPGESRAFEVGAWAADNKHRAYIGVALCNETGVLRWHTDRQNGGSWGGYQWERGPEPRGRLRIARAGGLVRTWYEKEGAWVQLSKWVDTVRVPLHLYALVQNNWLGSAPCAFAVTVEAESLSLGPDYAVVPEASPVPVVATGLGEPGGLPPPAHEPGGAATAEAGGRSPDEAVTPSPISGLEIGTDATEDGKPVGASDHFAQATKLCAFFRFKEAPVGTNVTIVWLREGVEESRDEMDVDGNGRAWFSLTCGPQFDEGAWEVQLRIGDKLVARKGFRIGP